MAKARRDDIQERCEDALFAQLMEDLAADEGRRARRENELLLSDPGSAVPEDARRRCLRSIRRGFAARRARAAVRAGGKVLGQFAAAMLAVTVLFTTAFAASEPFRRGGLGLMEAVFPDHTEIQFDPAEPVPCQSIEPGWLPEGFEAEDCQVGLLSASRVLRGPGDRRISVTVVAATSTGTMGLDTEDAEVTSLTVRGCEAMGIVKGEPGDPLRQVTLCWFDRDRSWLTLLVTETEDLDTLAQVADNLELS